MFGSFDATRLKCNYIHDIPNSKLRLFLLVSVCRGLEEDEIFVDFLFRRFYTCLKCVLLYLPFVHRVARNFVV